MRGSQFTSSTNFPSKKKFCADLADSTDPAHDVDPAQNADLGDHIDDNGHADHKDQADQSDQDEMLMMTFIQILITQFRSVFAEALLMRLSILLSLSALIEIEHPLGMAMCLYLLMRIDAHQMHEPHQK